VNQQHLNWFAKCTASEPSERYQEAIQGPLLETKVIQRCVQSVSNHHTALNGLSSHVSTAIQHLRACCQRRATCICSMSNSMQLRSCDMLQSSRSHIWCAHGCGSCSRATRLASLARNCAVRHDRSRSSVQSCPGDLHGGMHSDVSGTYTIIILHCCTAPPAKYNPKSGMSVFVLSFSCVHAKRSEVLLSVHAVHSQH
jgi:hypothetical protein